MYRQIAEKEWPEVRKHISQSMTERVAPYLASISLKTPEGKVFLLGSGIYLELNGAPYLLTCEHIARNQGRNMSRLGHVLEDGANYLAFPHPFAGRLAPEDLAITQVHLEYWKSGTRLSLPIDQVALSHQPAENELLFMCGYPGERSYFSPFDSNLVAKVIPYSAPQVALPADRRFTDEFHFAIPYSTELAESLSVNQSPLPKAGGFSGAPVWDTRFVAGGCTTNWSAVNARLTGIAFWWDQKDGRLVCTRAEKVRQFISDFLREKPAG
jgi:trypsin-like peptidase